MSQDITFIGLDIGKARIEVSIANGEASKTITNDRRSLAALARQLGKLPNARVVLEAAGGYERLVRC